MSWAGNGLVGDLRTNGFYVKLQTQTWSCRECPCWRSEPVSQQVGPGSKVARIPPAPPSRRVALPLHRQGSRGQENRRKHTRMLTHMHTQIHTYVSTATNVHLDAHTHTHARHLPTFHLKRHVLGIIEKSTFSQTFTEETGIPLPPDVPQGRRTEAIFSKISR